MSSRRVHDWFADRAAAAPERTAIEYRTIRQTYADLDGRANRLANFLIEAGAARGSRVAILAGSPLHVVAGILAALKAGLVFVPLDPRSPDAQLQAMASEASIEWLIVEAAHAAKARALASVSAAPLRVVCVDSDSVFAGETGLTALPYADYSRDVPVSVDRPADDCCYIYFTSGSTGRPKGIAGRLRAIDHFIAWEIRTFGVTDGVRVSQLTTPSFDASLRDFFLPLCAGGTICAPESPDLKLDSARLLRWLDDERINLVHCVPSVFRAMLNEGLEPGALSSLRHVLLAGEAVLPSDVRRWTDVYGDRVQLVNLYGPSETTMTKFFHVVTRADADRSSVPIGVPMDGTSALIVDEKGRPCPRGAVGEIWIRTPYRTLGYFNRPELTADAFIPNPFGSDPNDLVYKTGDLARTLTSGAFELVGRKDHQVKIRGERIELGAVEAALRRHPGVADAVVVDREDAGGIKYLSAYVVLHDGTTTADVRTFVAKDLPPAMVPSAFTPMEQLPRLLTGKVDRRALPLDDTTAMVSAVYEAPRNELESALAALFAAVLARPGVGIRDNFFELGGHSLLATQLVSRIRKAFAVDLPVRSLFDAPTVAGIAEHVEVLRWAAAPAPVGPAAAGVAELEL
jgi:amino acid adenylation domain-containing protein